MIQRSDSEHRWKATCEAFDHAVTLDLPARREFLARLAEEDSALHDAVEKLLASDEIADEVIGSLDDPYPPDHIVDVLNLAGKQIGPFRVVAPIAVGGMGVVYRAEHLSIGRRVALKLPLPSIVGNASARARFLREGRAAGRLEHPHICRVHEVGESDGLLYLAMPLYEGETLRQRLDRSPRVPVTEAIRITRQIAEGLAAAHGAGIVHRDLKPENVMLEHGTEVRILDFGLAQMFEATNTRSSATLGTPSYMAPERIRGEATDARADLWSLGVVLYEMLVGARPFTGDHSVAISHAVLHYEPLSVRRQCPETPARLDALVSRLMSRSVDDRPDSAQTVLRELTAIASGARAPWRQHLAETFARRLRGVRTLRARVVVGGFAALSAVALIDTARTPTTERSRPDTYTLTSSDAEASLYFQRAQAYMAREPSINNFRIAIEQYERAVARDSLFARAFARLAIARFQVAATSDPPDSLLIARARIEADRALRLYPGLPEAHLAAGYLFSGQGMPDSAIARLRLAMAGMPESVEPVSQLALAHRIRGDWAEAKRLYLRAASMDSSNVRMLTQVATTLYRTRDYASAVGVLDRLILLEPERNTHGLMRGEIFIRWHGEPDSLARRLRELPPAWNPGGIITLAQVQVARYKRRPEDALAILDQSDAAAFQDNVFFYPRALVRGWLLADLGRRASAAASFAEAIPLLEDSVRARPFDIRMQTALGDAYAGAGRRALAMSRAHALAEFSTGSASYMMKSVAMLGAAAIYTRAGAHDDAIAVLDQLLDRSAGREASVPLLQLDPTWDPLRSDPRFTAMLTRPRVRRD